MVQFMDIPTGILKLLICLHILAFFQIYVNSNWSKKQTGGNVFE